MELARSADFLCRKILEIRSGENVVIYADTATDPRVVQATSAVAHTIGAKVTTVWYETKGDIDLPPPEPVEAAVLAADLVIEFATAYLCHSAMWEKARRKGVPTKCLTGMNVDMMIRCINPETHQRMTEFGEAYKKVIEKGKERGRVTNRAGTDFTFKFWTTETYQKYLKWRGRETPAPSRYGMMGGQGVLNANVWTLNGTIVFDGAFWPPAEVGALKEPLEMKVENGNVTEVVSDHQEARIVKNWFAHFYDEDAYSILHVSMGYNPGVKRITGDIVEDERVFGCVEVGIGLASPKL